MIAEKRILFFSFLLVSLSKTGAGCGCMQENHAMLLLQKANRQPGQEMASSGLHCLLAFCVIACISMSRLAASGAFSTWKSHSNNELMQSVSSDLLTSLCVCVCAG